MNIVVLGLWHLGSVTAAGMAWHHRATGLGFDDAVVVGLRAGRAPGAAAAARPISLCQRREIP